MNRELVVIVGGVVAGTLVREGRRALRFDYDEEYSRQPDPTPLSVSMPTAVKSHSDEVVSPWLWGLLPDNFSVLGRWAREFQVPPSSPAALLGSPVGEDCAGAVRFAPPDQLAESLGDRAEVAWLSDDEVSQRIRELRQDATAWLGRDPKSRFSLSGAQAKTALMRMDGRWGVPHGALPTTHILKPAIPGMADHDINEHICMDAAHRVGLLAARTSIERFGEESAIVVERYDRASAGGRIQRVHQEDMCQALGVMPSRKYQSDGGPSAGDIAALIRRVMTPGAAEEAVGQFADALIWNWLIAGTDAHAKNYSVLMAGNQVRLAPLYDVASGLPYAVHEKKMRFAMKIGGDYRVWCHPAHDTWTAASRELGLDPERLRSRVRELGGRIADAFVDAAGTEQVRAMESPLPAKLVDLVAERAARCMRLLEPGRGAMPLANPPGVPGLELPGNDPTAP